MTAFRVAGLRFAKDGPEGVPPWSCSDATLTIYRRSPLRAWLAMEAWYRREPRRHWPGCDGRHRRGALCPQAMP